MILTLITDSFSSKKRSLRVEAQKQLWSLIRYKNMVYIFNTIMDLQSLTWDGYTIFRHCSPLDPDFQTHFFFKWEMNFKGTYALVQLQCEECPEDLLCTPIRDILQACVR